MIFRLRAHGADSFDDEQKLRRPHDRDPVPAASTVQQAAAGPYRTATIMGLGAVDERFKSHAWKACEG